MNKEAKKAADDGLKDIIIEMIALENGVPLTQATTLITLALAAKMTSEERKRLDEIGKNAEKGIYALAAYLQEHVKKKEG
jgi:hypothetical protein